VFALDVCKSRSDIVVLRKPDELADRLTIVEKLPPIPVFLEYLVQAAFGVAASRYQQEHCYVFGCGITELRQAGC
jgi:hypothetical protein